MAQRNHDPHFTNTTCSICGCAGHAKSGTPHRRCIGSRTTNDSGEVVQRRRPKHDLLDAKKRGTWQ